MKWGLGESYDKVLLSKRLRAYLDITKPASTLGVMGAFALASLFYFYYAGEQQLILENAPTILVVIFTVGLSHGASQAMNMAEDAEIDRQTPHKKNRPIPSGIITEEDARSVSWLCSGLAIGLSFTVNNTFGSFILVLMFFGIFYNLDPIRAKGRIISIPWQAMSRGLLSFPAVWAAYGDPFDPTAWVFGLFMFFYVLGFQNTADIIDREIDAEYGISTFVVEFGVWKTVLIAYGCTWMMVMVVGASTLLGIAPSSMYSLIIIVPFCLLMLKEMWENPHKVSEKTGNHPAWLWFYFGMVLIVLLPLVSEIVTA